MKKIVLLLILIPGCSVSKISPNLVDARDEQTYLIHSFNGKQWMTEDLKLFIPGDSLVTSFPNAQHAGRLYSFESVKKVCPPGWHLPTKKEWSTLIDGFPGIKNSRGGRIITKRDASDSAALNIRMNGFRLGKDRHVALGRMTIYWTASDTTFTGMQREEWNGKRFIGYHFYEASADSIHAEPTYTGDSSNGYYCRCVKNSK